jgi:hypothetical protein
MSRVYKLKMHIDEIKVVVWPTDQVSISYPRGILRFMGFSESKRQTGHIMPVVVHRRAIFGTDSSPSGL